MKNFLWMKNILHLTHFNSFHLKKTNFTWPVIEGRDQESELLETESRETSFEVILFSNTNN